MKRVVVKKDRLLEVLKANRETHQKDFDLAWEGFREKAVANATAKVDALKNLRKGQQIDLWINLELPVNHVEDYDRAIQMVDWEVGDQVELSDTEFRHYVQDNWAWKQQFSTSNMAYTGSVSPSSNGGS